MGKASRRIRRRARKRRDEQRRKARLSDSDALTVRAIAPNVITTYPTAPEPAPRTPYTAPIWLRTPALARDDFRALVKRVAKDASHVIVASPRVLGPDPKHFDEARRKLEGVGSRLFAVADLERDRIEADLESEPLRTLLGRVAEHTRLEIGPNTLAVTPEQMRGTTSMTNGEHAFILLDGAERPVGIAHEVLHIELDREGYPALDGGAFAGLTCAILDREVVDRMEALGLDPVARMDADLAARDGEALAAMEPAELLTEAVRLLNLPTQTPAVRDALIDCIEALDANAVAAARAVVAIVTDGDGLDDAEHARITMAAAVEVLRVHRFPVPGLVV